MSETDTGRSPSGPGSRASHGAADGVSAVPASIPSADYLSLIERFENAPNGHPELDHAIGSIMHRRGWHAADCLGRFTQSLDSALRLLPDGADWRKLTNPSISVYAANPYNADAQKRHDGNGATPALQMCAAAFRLMVDPVLKAEAVAARKASAIEARRAETGTGSVHG